MPEKTLRVKFATWKRLMELSLSLGDSQRLSIDAVIGRLLGLWDGQKGLNICGTCATVKAAEDGYGRGDVKKDSEGITTRMSV